MPSDRWECVLCGVVIKGECDDVAELAVAHFLSKPPHTPKEDTDAVE